MTGLTAKGIWLLGALGVGLLLQGCREGEQDRPLLYDKGTYLGETGQPLDPQQVEELRSRAQNQRF
jgi:hypothetical protein